mgnify:CR=1 FL=1
MNYTIEKITTLLGARRIGTADAEIGWLLTDSRSLCFPEQQTCDPARHILGTLAVRVESIS